MAARNDRLKKLEAELKDLEHWLELGLVPKKDIPKHDEEIAALRVRIDEEEQKIRYLKETGEVEEYVTPRKQPGRAAYTDSPTLPDVDMTEEQTATAETSSDRGSDTLFETTFEEDEATATEEGGETETEEDDPFSDANRWKRGMLHSEDEEW
jgi:hypothetical protein